jgi:predicted membrane chloride channel (bestrophin family)
MPTSVSISSLVDHLTSVERIANTPIPKSCTSFSWIFNRLLIHAGLALDGIHLKQCVTLYLFSLPFTMVKELGWATVPVVTVVAFTFMGIEGIAEQIEMPFGKNFTSTRYTVYSISSCIGLDEADLPLGGSGHQAESPFANSVSGSQIAIARI